MVSKLSSLALASALLAAAPVAAQTPLPDSQGVQGMLESTDPRLPDGAHYDEFTFTLACSNSVSIWQESGEIDARFVLGIMLDGAFFEKYGDDDSGNGRNALIRDLLLAPDTYILRASSKTPQTGSYGVTLRRRVAEPEPGEPCESPS